MRIQSYLVFKEVTVSKDIPWLERRYELPIVRVDHIAMSSHDNDYRSVWWVLELLLGRFRSSARASPRVIAVL